MEYLDYYNENGDYLGKETRDFVHENGLWHKTIHCWLYDKKGNIFFQIRQDSKKLYTTASGHISAGETLKIGFAREIFEETGLHINVEDAQMIEMCIWKMDKKKEGKILKDRVFANVYMCEFNGDMAEFNIDTVELAGIVKVNAEKTLDVLRKESGEISCQILTLENNQKEIKNSTVSFEDFLVNPGEIALIKYGRILQSIIAQTEK